jgi:hypothetical protein
MQSWTSIGSLQRWPEHYKVKFVKSQDFTAKQNIPDSPVITHNQGPFVQTTFRNPLAKVRTALLCVFYTSVSTVKPCQDLTFFPSNTHLAKIHCLPLQQACPLPKLMATAHSPLPGALHHGEGHVEHRIRVTFVHLLV